MAISHRRALRKASGGRYKQKGRKEKYHELGRQPANTLIGKRRSRSIRTMGSNQKVRILASDIANLFDPKTKKFTKAVAKLVVQNPANRHYVRKNILTKGAIVETDKGKARITNRPGQEGSVNAILIG